MALSNAIPRLSEIPGQLTPDTGENPVEYATAVLITVGSLASMLVAVASLLLLVGFGTELGNSVLGFTWDVPFIGVTKVVPALAFAGMVTAALIAFRIAPLADPRERLWDDVNAILVFNAIGFFAAAFSTNIELPNSMMFAFSLLGLVFATMYVVNVGMARR